MATLDFSPGEYEQRVAAVRREMQARGADVLVVDQIEHVAYLFGYLPAPHRYQACLLPLRGAPHMIVRALDVPTFVEQSWVESYAVYGDDEDAIELTAGELGRLGLAGAGVAIETDSNFMTVGRYHQLGAALPKAHFVDFSRVMWELRLIKSEAELGYLREAARIADTALKRAVDSVTEGCSERKPAAAAYATAIDMGADNGRVLLLASGASSDTLHGRLGRRRLAAGDILHLELVPQVRGYSARLMRPTVIGAPTRDQRWAAERLIAIQDEQIAAMRPGAAAADVDRIGREQVLREGLRTAYPYLTGYTLGYHAQPRTSDHTRTFQPDSSWTLEAGMVFHMYLWVRGMAFSETILVGREGPERLTETERVLFVR